MEIYLADQTRSFLYSCGLGAMLGVFYDLFRILRIAFPTRRWAVFVQDVIYWAACALLSYLFLLTQSDGVVRVFLLVGELLGATLYRYTLGRLVMRVAEALIAAVKAVLRFLYRYLFRPIWRLFYNLISLLMKPVRFTGRNLKKTGQRLKFRLKVRRILLYNHYKGLLRKRKGPKKAGESVIYGAEEAEAGQ